MKFNFSSCGVPSAFVSPVAGDHAGFRGNCNGWLTSESLSVDMALLFFGESWLAVSRFWFKLLASWSLSFLGMRSYSGLAVGCALRRMDGGFLSRAIVVSYDHADCIGGCHGNLTKPVDGLRCPGPRDVRQYPTEVPPTEGR